MIVDDPNRVANLARIAGVPCDDAEALSNRVRMVSGVMTLATMEDAELARHLRNLPPLAPAQEAAPLAFPHLNEGYPHDVRVLAHGLDLDAVPAWRRMGVIAQLKAKAARSESNAGPKPSSKSLTPADAAYYAGLQGEKKIAAMRAREAGRKALRDAQDLASRLPTLSPTARSAAADTMARYATIAERGGFKLP